MATFAEDILKSSFLVWKLFYCDSKFTCICPPGFIWWWANNSSDNGLVLSRQLAIVSTNDGIIYWSIYASSGFSELIYSAHSTWKVEHSSPSQPHILFTPFSCGSTIFCGLLPVYHVLCIHTTFQIPKWMQTYRQISNIRCTKSSNLKIYRLVLQLSLCNLLKPGVESKMKM